MASKTVVLMTRVPKALQDRLTALKKTTGLPKEKIIQAALEQYLDARPASAR